MSVKVDAVLSPPDGPTPMFYRTAPHDETYVLACIGYTGEYIAVSIDSGECWSRPTKNMAEAVDGLVPFYGTITIEVTP